MLKATAVFSVIALILITFALSSFSLNFEDIEIYPVDSDEVQTSIPQETDRSVQLILAD